MQQIQSTENFPYNPDYKHNVKITYSMKHFGKKAVWKDLFSFSVFPIFVFPLNVYQKLHGFRVKIFSMPFPDLLKGY